ncbi:MAG: HD-GYP domain-containing protein [Planctomycetes bacterium]|nr:HD-GYP domain-containing protein [Planctomycetota bacterium]
MTTKSGLLQASPASEGVVEVHRRLEELRFAVSALDPGLGLDEKLWNLSQAAERMVTENAGMADELLGVYEQLGIVFEVTSKLSCAERESEVLDLFRDSLQKTFDRCAIGVMYTCDDGAWYGQGDTIDIDPWMQTLLENAKEGGRVVVETRPAEGALRSPVEVMVSPVFAGDLFVCAITLVRGGGLREFRASDMMLLESLAMFCGDLIRNHRLVIELRAMSVSMVRALVNAIDQKDEYTSGHSLRVGYYATELGKRLRLPKVDLQMLQWSALLHDVGKIGIRDSVLNKRGKLTAEEWAHIQEHPVRSHQVVKEVPQLADALDGVLYHHERMDGQGYPEKLAGEDIPLQARIIQVVDIFDALTSNRSYRGAFEWRGALKILQNDAGIVSDAELVTVFVEMMNDLLGEDEAAWDGLVQRAVQFNHLSSDDEEVTGNL